MLSTITPYGNSETKLELEIKERDLFDIHASVVFADDQANVYLGTDNESTKTSIAGRPDG